MPDKPEYPHVERNAVFCEAAELLFGKRWGRQLAAALHTPQSTIAAIATGRRAVTPELEMRLAARIQLEFIAWEHRAAELAPLMKQLAADKGDTQ